MAITIHTAEELPKILATLCKERTNGADGVKVFDSGRGGSRLAITMMTHGNEAAGLAAVLPFLRGEIELTAGSVVAAISNMPAALVNRRKIENLDYNRIPPDFLDESQRASYNAHHPESLARMLALRDAGVFDATHGLDLHTVHGPSDPILLHIRGDDGFPAAIGVPNLITDISVPQCNLSGERAICFGDFIGGTGNRDIPVVEVEGGGPGAEPHVIRGVMSGVLSVLASLGMIDPKTYGMIETPVRQTIYRTSGWAMSPAGYRIANPKFNVAFAPAKRGDVLLEDMREEKREPITIPKDSRLLFPIPNQEILDTPDDWFYAMPNPEERDIVAWVLSDGR